MFRALGRWVKAFGYLITGQLDSARRTLDTNPHVVRARYDEIIRDKTTRIHQYKQAVAGLIAQQEQKIAKAKDLTVETRRLQDLKAGALAKAQKRVAELKAKGIEGEAIKSDEDYRKCLSAFNDFSSTLAERQARIDELEKDVAEYGRRLADHKVQLQELVRDLDKIRAEQHEAVADVITANQEKEIADALSGISKDGTSESLMELRRLRQEVKAEARVSREMAGTDTKAQEAEFLEYARTSSSNSEFEALVGLAGEVDKPKQAAEQQTKLPE